MAKLVTSCCKRPPEECPGCPGGMELVPEESHKIYKKIQEGIVTAEDFNQLISEAMPECTRDRVRRRTTKNVTDSHQDSEGHQKLKSPTFADRVQPKREKSSNSQMKGRGKSGHRRSTRTQNRQRKNG